MLKISNYRFAALAVGFVVLGSSAAMAKDDCKKIDADGWASNIGTGKAQARAALAMKAEAWGAQRVHMTKLTTKEVECKKMGTDFACEAEGTVCEVE